MFRNSLAAEPADDVVATADLIPLSHFALDYPQPVEGWAVFLGRKAIAFVPDSLGRDCIRYGDAKRLLDEHRANEIRKARLPQLAEQEAVEANQQFRASLPRGVPVSAIPEGAT
jgi:hypothetical protein